MPYSENAGTPAAAVSVATTDTLVLAANRQRLSATFCNNGSNVIYLRLGTGAAVAGQGIRLAAGQTVTLDNYTGEVRGIALTAATSLTLVQV